MNLVLVAPVVFLFSDLLSRLVQWVWAEYFHWCSHCFCYTSHCKRFSFPFLNTSFNNHLCSMYLTTFWFQDVLLSVKCLSYCQNCMKRQKTGNQEIISHSYSTGMWWRVKFKILCWPIHWLTNLLVFSVCILFHYTRVILHLDNCVSERVKLLLAISVIKRLNSRH